MEAPPALDKALTALEDALGGREEMVSKLALVTDLTSEETTILNLLANPENRNRSMAWLCGNAGTSIGRVLAMLQKGEFAEAVALSMKRIARQLPKVAEDVMARALPIWKSCLACGALGRLPPKEEGGEPRTCLVCEGVGRVEVAPDVERQKVALQVGGLLKQGGGVSIDNRQQTVNANGPVVLVKSSPDFRTATDKLLYPGRAQHQLNQTTTPPNFVTEDPLDAEVIEDGLSVLPKSD